MTRRKGKHIAICLQSRVRNRKIFSESFGKKLLNGIYIHETTQEIFKMHQIDITFSHGIRENNRFHNIAAYRRLAISAIIRVNHIYCLMAEEEKTKGEERQREKQSEASAAELGQPRSVPLYIYVFGVSSLPLFHPRLFTSHAERHIIQSKGNREGRRRRRKNSYI